MSTALQRKIRKEARVFVGCVYWQPGDVSRQHLVREFRRMRQTGFDVVRCHEDDPERMRLWLDAAKMAGIRVICHFERATPTDATLAKHGVQRDEYDASFLEGEDRLLKPLEETVREKIGKLRRHPALYAWGVFGEPGSAAASLDSEIERAAFASWLRKTYKSPAALDRAWNIYPTAGKLVIESFEEAWRAMERQNGPATYGAKRDLMRFQTDRALARARATVAIFRKLDPMHPLFVGSHQLFLNQPTLRWDTAQWGRLGDLHFSSIHLSWHFEVVRGELDRAVYMQARLTRDAFKGGWTSCYETTGGAVQYSGGYGNSMSAGLMRRLMLSYLAAGNQSIAFWTWNHRPGGWEAGEYGLTTWSGRLTPWAKEAGKVAQAMRRYRRELWDADNETRVGILQCWDTDAVLACEPERHDLKNELSEFASGTKVQAQRAAIGAARAFINQRVPFEFVTGHDDLSQYPVLCAPHLRAASVELLEKLLRYLRNGGRLIADVQFGFCDPWGKMHPRGKGTLLEKLFGGWVDMIHDTRTGSVRFGEIPVNGFYGDIVTTTAEVLGRLDNGQPAIVERGRATLIGFDAARMCFQSGNVAVEKFLADLVMRGVGRGWETDAPIAFRRRSKAADHYFLINDGPARTVELRVHDRKCRWVEWVVEGEKRPIENDLRVKLPKESGIWLRLS